MDRWKRGIAALALVCAAAAPVCGAAGEAQERLFAFGVLDGVATGETLLFRHERLGSAAVAPALPPVPEGRVEMRLQGSASTDGRDAVVTLREGERARVLNPFPAAAGNPLLMVFMETSVRSMAAAAGGSPFYIRNRMREALRTQDQGEPVEVQVDGRAAEGWRYAFRPFAGDPNAARMGAFADLEISFVLSDAAPGRFVELETVTGPDAAGAPALRERFVYLGKETRG